jgi:hypothetical protein
MCRVSILAEVSAERDRQDAMFGGSSHDDTHSATDWGAILIRHLGLAFDDGKPADVCLMNDHCAGYDSARYRRQMVRVAAIAVAALEVFHRKVAVVRKPSWWQRVADQLGETVLVLAQRDPALYSEGLSLPYAVTERQASAWERTHAALTVEPTRRAQS